MSVKVTAPTGWSSEPSLIQLSSFRRLEKLPMRSTDFPSAFKTSLPELLISSSSPCWKLDPLLYPAGLNQLVLVLDQTHLTQTSAR